MVRTHHPAQGTRAGGALGPTAQECDRDRSPTETVQEGTQGDPALEPGGRRTLLAAARGDRLEALYVLAVTVGLRQGELLLGLRWQDVDLGEAGGTLSVRQQLTRLDECDVRFTEPKSKNGRRSVRLSKNAVNALKCHKAAQTRRAARPGSLWRDQGLVFANRTGAPLDVGNLTNYSFRPLLEHAGLPRVRFQDLLHTRAPLLLTRNVNPNIMQETLDHANILETMDTYSHVLPRMGDTTAGAMDEALSWWS
jgi:integrase